MPDAAVKYGGRFSRNREGGRFVSAIFSNLPSLGEPSSLLEHRKTTIVGDITLHYPNYETRDKNRDRQPSHSFQRQWRGDMHDRKSSTTASVKPGRPELVGFTETYWDPLTNREPLHNPNWKPTFFQIRPLIGLAGLGLAVGCIFVSLAILVSSNRQPTRTWSYQPQVYLAIVTAISNIAVQCALNQAAPIAWWHKALRGATIGDLEVQWEAGQSWIRASYNSLVRRRGTRLFNLLTIANMATALVMIDGPLLQRSPTVQSAMVAQNVTLHVPLSPQLPPGFSGQYYHSLGSWDPSNIAVEVSHQMTKQTPMLVDTTCAGTCTTKIQGPGLEVAGCTSQSWPVTKQMMLNPTSTWGDNNGSKPFLYTALGVPMQADTEFMLYRVGVLHMQDCKGEYVLKTCKLQPVINEYDATLQTGAISFPEPLSSGKVVGHPNNNLFNTTVGGYQPRSNGPHEPMAFSLWVFEDGPAYCMNWTLSTQNPGTIAQPYFPGMTYMPGGQYSQDANQCVTDVQDPTDYIISQFNELMIRGALVAATWSNITSLVDPGLSVNQSVLSHQTQQETVFVSDLRWFAGAAAIQIATILILLPVFWGWWRIGIDTSLSPFNTAKMLDPSLMKDLPCRTDVNGILEALGPVKVRLGEMRPKQVGKYLSSRWERNVAPRIGIARADAIRTPEVKHWFHLG